MNLYDFVYGVLSTNEECLIQVANCRMSYGTEKDRIVRAKEAIAKTLMSTLDEYNNGDLDTVSQEELSDVCHAVAEDYVNHDLF